ncbi:MAG: DUF1566 domain-containing protein [Porphyromonadaceae bacterium]|nr:DUF1566 domain-containing protein [Porphyromonadaceae bacterium]
MKNKIKWLLCALAMGLTLQGCSSDDDDVIDNNPLQEETGSTINGHEYVDLGLSVMWATCNVGADSPSDYGNYYAWGETETKSEYTSSTSITYEKEMEDIAGNVDYDAACADWGNPWRMPTEAEMEELINKCQWTWTKMGKHEGYKVIGPNGNSLFLPAAGWCAGDSLYEKGEDGRYWSSTPNGSDLSGAYGISFDSRDSNGRNYGRNWGYSIRPVSSETPTGTLNGHEYIDLGLTSGLMWATCNVGASSPSDYGDYYAWGETVTKSEYTEDNCVTQGKEMDDIAGNPDYDVARANWGGQWRMPTKDEITELMNECQWEWTTIDGHNGYKVTGPNGKSIFLPAAGGREWTSLANDGKAGYYQSSLPNKSDLNFVYFFYFDNQRLYGSWGDRYSGQSVRPVSGEGYLEKQSEDENSTTQNVTPTGTLDGHDYVDLGLSVMWATCNVGADSPSDYGDYYAWGETETKEEYTENNSVTYEKEMGDITGDSNYDVARTNWGDSWRMPTEGEIDELVNECQWEWTTMNDHNGIKVTGPNGNSIFLPAAGYYNGTTICNAWWDGDYWGASPYKNTSDYAAYSFGFSRTNFTMSRANRFVGYSVRPVSGEDPLENEMPSGSLDGHDYVDLGLSVMWATCNVGASSSFDYGDYYAWGEIETKSSYTSSNSIWYGVTVTENEIKGNPEYDAARANWGGIWRLPTADEIDELVDCCTWEWMTRYGHNGYKVTGPNGNSIFLPTSSNAGSYGYYWSCSPVTSSKYLTFGLYFSSSSFFLDSNASYEGRSVRPVSKEDEDSSTQDEEENEDSSTQDEVITDANGHDYVDLGLSVKWATCNIGADVPADCGNYYAWGEITTKSSYSSSNSTWYGKSVTEATIKGNPLYDAATANWGGTWRLPTKSEIIELVSNCTTEWTTQDGHKGYLVTSKINGNSIFLPAAGNYFGTTLYGAGSYGDYWSSSPYESSTINAYGLDFGSGSFYLYNSLSRITGQSVRPVLE